MAPFRFLLLPLLLLLAAAAAAQSAKDAALADIRQYQQELNASYRDPQKSPLEPDAREKFKGLPFFPADLKYRVQATLVRTENEPVFKMPTSTTRLADYRKYGEVVFELEGKTHRLSVYQSPDLLQKPGYHDYLFLPFTDLSTGRQTYAAGRYLELRIPAEGDVITVDFNKAYNPYCAYSSRYSCPKVPAENHLQAKVLAGVKYKK